MHITMIGSHLCPDTIDAMNKLLAAGAEISFKDILSCHADLKEYLKLRATSPVYAEIRGTDMLGVPCFICDDGTVTLNIEDVLKK